MLVKYTNVVLFKNRLHNTSKTSTQVMKNFLSTTLLLNITKYGKLIMLSLTYNN